MANPSITIDLKTKLEALKKAVDELQDLSRQGRTTGNQLDSSFRQASKGVQVFGRDLKTLKNDLNRLGKELAIKVTAPIVAIGVASLKSAIDFESSFTGVRKTVNATEAEFRNLEQGFRDMAKQIPINVNELNAIGESAGQLGIETQNILAFTEVMAKLGVTTNLTAEQASTALARFANITGLPQTQFEELGSTIVQLGNNLATTEAEIVEFGLRLAGAGNQIGLSQDQILAFGGALSSLGLNAEAGGTAFSKIFLKMASAVETGGDELAQFANVADLSVSEFSTLFKQDASEAVLEFISGLGNMEKRGSSTIRVLEDMGLTEIRLRDALLRSSGAVDLLRKSLGLAEQGWRENNALTREAELRFKTASSQLKFLFGDLRDLAITIGDILLPHFLDFLSFARRIIKALSDLDPTVVKIGVVIAGLVASIAPLLLGISTAITLFGVLSKGLTGAGLTFAKLATPIGLAVIAIGSLTFATIQIIENWETLKEIANEVWESIRNKINDVINFLKKPLQDFVNAIDDVASSFKALIGLDPNKALGGGDKNLLDKLLIEPEQIEQTQQGLVGITNNIKEQKKAVDDTTDSYQAFLNRNTEVNNKQKEFVTKLKETKQATKEAKEAVDNLSGDGDGGGGGGGGGGLPKLADEIEQLNKTIQSQIEQLRFQKASIGLSEKALIELEATTLLQKGANEQLVETFKNLKLEILAETEALKEQEKQLDRLKTVTEQLDKLELEFLPDTEKIKRETAEKVREIALLAVEGNKEIAQRINALIGQAIEQGNKKSIEAARQAFITTLKESESFFDRAKGQFLEFAESFRDNSDAIGQFFANTMSAMSQSFSDLFFNVLTGKFDNLKDIAKQTFEAILRSAIDLFTALATKQIVLNIAGNIQGTGAGGGSGGGFGLGNIIGGLGDSFGALTSIPSAIGGLFGGGGGATASTFGILNPASITGASSLLGGASGGLGSLFSLIGSALPAIGVIVAGISLIAPLISSLFKDSKRIRLGFKELTSVADIIANNTGDIASRNLPDELEKTFVDIVRNQIIAIQSVFEDISDDALDELLATDVEFRLSTKSRSGDKLKAKVQRFIEGGFIIPLFEDLEDSFVTAIQDIGTGVGKDVAQTFTDTLQAELEGLFDTLPRDEAGRAISEAFNEFLVQLTAIDNAFDSLVPAFRETAIEIINSSSSIGEAFDRLNAEIQKADAVVNTITGLASSIQSTISLINGLNLGIDTSGFTQSTIDSVLAGFDSAVTIEQQKALLQTLTGLVGQLEADFAQSQQQIAQAQQANIQRNITSLNREKELIRDIAKDRIDALQEELRTVQALEQLSKDVSQNIQDLLLSPQSILTVFERLQLAQTQIDQLFTEFESASIADQADLGKQLQDLINQSLGISGEAFQKPSLEFRDDFRTTIADLTRLQEMIEPIRSSEEIQAEIESINIAMEAHLQSIDARIDSLQNATVTVIRQTNAEINSLKQFIADQALLILQAELQQLQELTQQETITELGVAQEQLIVLREIRDSLSGVPTFQHGTTGFQDFGRGTLAMLHGREAVIPATQNDSNTLLGSRASNTINLSFNFNNVSQRDSQTLKNEFINLLLYDTRIRRELERLQ